MESRGVRKETFQNFPNLSRAHQVLPAQTSTGDREDGEGEVCRRVRIQPCMDKGHACDPSGNGYANRVELGHTEACFGKPCGVGIGNAQFQACF